MSFQIEGQPFIPNFRAKEKRLYQIIASRDDEIKALNASILEREATANKLASEVSDLRAEIRTLRSKEYRRMVRRKKQREQPDGGNS